MTGHRHADRATHLPRYVAWPLTELARRRVRRRGDDPRFYTWPVDRYDIESARRSWKLDKRRSSPWRRARRALDALFSSWEIPF